jgi:hypothetical protein
MFHEKFTYFNAPIYVQKIDPQSNDLSAQYNDTTLTNILKDTNNTDFAIERYSMNCGGTLPILDFIGNYQITIFGNIKGKNVSQTTTLSYTNIYGSQTQGSTFIYNMYHFMDILNNAFVSCMNSIQAGLIGTTMTTQPPFITFYSASNLFSIFTDNTGFGNTPSVLTESLNMKFSNDLYNILRYFNYTIDTLNNATLNISKSPLDSATINSNPWTENKQLFNSTSIWSPVRDIQFRTNLPLSFEYYGDISVLGNGRSLGDNFLASQEQVITDIKIDNVVNDWNTEILYTSPKYRWINMSKAQDIKDIKFSVFWNHKNGSSYPLLMPNNSSIELKLLFRKKIL